MAVHGSLTEFNTSEDNWEEYIERLEQYFVANDIKDTDLVKRKRAVLLSSVGQRTYALIKTLLAPLKPTDKSYDELVKLVKDHLK